MRVLANEGELPGNAAGTPLPDSNLEQPPVIRRAEVVAFALISLLLICVGKGATSFPAFAACPSFAVNVLHDKQIPLSAAFASKAKDRFENVAHDTVHTGAPILRDCLTWFDRSVHQRLEVGDHVVLIGRIQAFGTSPSVRKKSRG